MFSPPYEFAGSREKRKPLCIRGHRRMKNLCIKSQIRVNGGEQSAQYPLAAIETAIKELPRDPETIALYKHLADHRPMPGR